MVKEQGRAGQPLRVELTMKDTLTDKGEIFWVLWVCPLSTPTVAKSSLGVREILGTPGWAEGT